MVNRFLNYTSFLINWTHFTHKSQITLNVLALLSGHVFISFMRASSQSL